MCHSCNEKDHALYVKDKYIRRLERKMQNKPTLSTVISSFTLLGILGAILLFSFRTYFDHNHTVLMAQKTQILATENKERIVKLEFETAKDIALINQNMGRVLKILEDKPR
ncbi:hypothetical protein AAIR98_000919 [Elusimicrobium simillimum]|uniref:hypothetical protein n=1 Tax=Elusimicrobium simillimum TaxID=3143438 RepID=UPI003C6F9956